MAANCGVCGLTCEEEHSLVKCSGNCGSVFHPNCVNTKTRGAKKDLLCDSCKPDRSSSLASSNKSASSTPISKEFLINTLESFKKEMLAEFKNSTAGNEDLRNSVQFLSDALDKSNKLLEEIKKELKKTQDENLVLRKENLQLKTSVTGLEVRVRNLEQHSRKQNIEIDGIPESQNENIEAILEDVAAVIGVELKKEKVVAAHRVPTFNRRRTPPIIVRFCTYEERDVWLAGFKRSRPVIANRINPSFNTNNKVFVNEHLSPENKLLLSKTKEVAKSKQYKYIWCRDGKVFVRREENTKYIRINTYSDLDKL